MSEILERLRNRKKREKERDGEIGVRERGRQNAFSKLICNSIVHNFIARVNSIIHEGKQLL